MDQRVLARLLELGIGGFVRKDEGIVRELPTRRLDELVRGERVSWKRALEIVRDLARAFATCESKALFPGPLVPHDIGIEPYTVLLAESFVAHMLGDPTPQKPGTEAPTRWTPPEQLDGAPWDNAANRYVIGLVLYRLLSGALPFGGAGLRADLRERSKEGAAPFAEEIAEALEPGVQSFALAMLAPKPAERPSNAEAIALRCEELLGERKKARSKGHVALPRAPAREKKKAARPLHPSLWAAIPIAVGVLFGSGLLWASGDAEEANKHSIAPLRIEQTSAESCGGCHARETQEWKRSVMAHAAKSPLYGALESLVEEQIGRSDECSSGGGVLRKAGSDPCFDTRTAQPVTGSGGEHWCVNCHAPGENASPKMPAWSANGDSKSRSPLRDLLGAKGLEGVGCIACHRVSGAHALRGDEGNANWTSIETGRTFDMRPDGRGISNSAYRLDQSLLTGDLASHTRVPKDVTSHLQSSELCGSCHDVRLFGTDAIGVKDRGEHFKRLRNAYSEWVSWAADERAWGRTPATCQGCHMSRFPGVCVPASSPGEGGCPSGTRFERHAPGDFLPGPAGGASHYFTSVDIPMTPEYPNAFASDLRIDAFGTPIGLEARREMLLRSAFRFAIGDARAAQNTLSIPIEIENVGGGHRVPAGFSQEREIWVELRIEDARGDSVYEVGVIAEPAEDLHDKRFVRVRTDDDVRDARGRPLGMFGADISDGPDLPQWSPNPRNGGALFVGKGLVNFQNGFLRCVRCIGFIDAQGKCQAGGGQGRTRADRYADGAYDADTGECRSNLSNGEELFETYFPVGALDADRGIAKAPDAIIDTRSAAPKVPVTYTYRIDTGAHPGPYRVHARLRFRPFPPFLIKAFADYEERMADRGLRPSGPQVTRAMLDKLRIVDLARVEVEIR